MIARRRPRRLLGVLYRTRSGRTRPGRVLPPGPGGQSENVFDEVLYLPDGRCISGFTAGRRGGDQPRRAGRAGAPDGSCPWRLGRCPARLDHRCRRAVRAATERGALASRTARDVRPDGRRAAVAVLLRRGGGAAGFRRWRRRGTRSASTTGPSWASRCARRGCACTGTARTAWHGTATRSGAAASRTPWWRSCPSARPARCYCARVMAAAPRSATRSVTVTFSSWAEPASAPGSTPCRRPPGRPAPESASNSARITSDKAHGLAQAAR